MTGPLAGFHERWCCNLCLMSVKLPWLISFQNVIAGLYFEGWNVPMIHDSHPRTNEAKRRSQRCLPKIANRGAWLVVSLIPPSFAMPYWSIEYLFLYFIQCLCYLHHQFVSSHKLRIFEWPVPGKPSTKPLKQNWKLPSDRWRVSDHELGNLASLSCLPSSLQTLVWF